MANPGKPDAIKKLPEALKESFGIITEACRKVGVSTETYYDWCKRYPDFKAECARARELGEQRGGDFVENSLYRKITEGDTACTLFYAKTKLKNRGYQERIVNHNTYDLGDLSDDELDMIESSIGRAIKDQSVNDNL